MEEVLVDYYVILELDFLFKVFLFVIIVCFGVSFLVEDIIKVLKEYEFFDDCLGKL